MKFWKSIKQSFVLVIVFLILVLILVSGVIYLKEAGSFMKGQGDLWGAVVGRAVGSFKGVTEGIGKGAEDGTSKGISAEDATVKLGNEMNGIGRLQVQQMDITMTDVFTQGDYCALIKFEGTAKFTVDLKQCKIHDSGDAINISIPNVVPEIEVDTEKVEILDEVNPRKNGGSTENGYKGYLNSVDNMNKKLSDTLTGYESMTELAESKALEIVESLAKSVIIGDRQVNVEYLKSTDTETNISESEVEE